MPLEHTAAFQTHSGSSRFPARSDAYPDKEHDIDKTGQYPRDRIGQINRFDSVIFRNLEHHRQPHQTQHTHAHNGNDHRHNRISDTTQCSHHNVHNAAESVNHRDIVQTHDSRGNDFRIAGVDVKQFVSEKYNRISQQRTSDDHAGFSQKYDSVDSLLFPCPVVLADKGKGGLIKGVHCHVHEPFQIGSSR